MPLALAIGRERTMTKVNNVIETLAYCMVVNLKFELKSLTCNIFRTVWMHNLPFCHLYIYDDI